MASPSLHSEAPPAGAPSHSSAAHGQAHSTPIAIMAHGLRLLIGAALVVTVVVAFPGPLVNRPDPARPPVVVGAIVSELNPDGRTLSVAVELTNSRAGDQSSETWWILARRGDGPPWEARLAYRSPVQRQVLAGGGSIRLRWVERVPLRPGVFELWAITHVERDGRDVHSDGRVAVQPLVTIGPAG